MPVNWTQRTLDEQDNIAEVIQLRCLTYTVWYAYFNKGNLCYFEKMVVSP